MTRYLLTSDKLHGSITYGFNDEGYLCLFEVNATNLNQQQWEHLLFGLGECLSLEPFRAWAHRYRFKVAEVPEDLSFERFWNDYGVKRNIDKARPIWEKMSEKDRQQVITCIPNYKRYCARNANWYNPKLPDTFLRNNCWKDDWDKA